jgi:hypothetical protein
MKRILIAPALALAIAFCSVANFAVQFRTVVAAGAPILTIFVQQGKITEAFKEKLLVDLNDEAGYIGTLGTCLDNAKEKPAKLSCIQTFEASTRPVLKRNFETNQTVSFIADDIEAIIQAATIFYGGHPSGVTAESAEQITEKEIKARVEKLKHDLGQS